MISIRAQKMLRVFDRHNQHIAHPSRATISQLARFKKLLVR